MQGKTRLPWISFIALLVVPLACVCGLSGRGSGPPGATVPPAGQVIPTDSPMPTATPDIVLPPFAGPITAPAATIVPGIIDRLTALGVPTADDVALYETLLNSERPSLDRIAEAIALRGLDPASIPEPPAAPARIYRVGDIETFWLHNQDSDTFIEAQAELVYISRHAYFWVDAKSVATNRIGERATLLDWQAAGDSFDNSYDAIREVFGSEVSPGIDGDPMLHIVHSTRLGSVGGYFSGPDLLPAVVESHSNEHEMFFVSITGTGGIAGSYYNSTLAHEFQHMVHRNIDINEIGWLDEGLSELAQQIAGMRGDDWASAYTVNPDQSLWYWSEQSSDYGHAYLIVDYLYERFGQGFIRALVANPANDMVSIDQTLAAVGITETFDQIYGDFMLALYLDDPTVGDGRYTFREAGFTTMRPTASLKNFPDAYSGEVHQYGIDILRLSGTGQATVSFVGAQTAMLVPVDAHSGTHMWWSNRGDFGISRLTRAVDLSGVDSATLSYWTWYDIEADWDYAYVMVSTDGGLTWEPQSSSSSTDRDPNSANYGHGLTGVSGSGAKPTWVREMVDLSAYAGQSILLRFALYNDEALHENGIVIDDVEIPEIGFADDMENGTNGWTAEGFVWIHNRVPQKWEVRLVLIGPSATVIQDLPIAGGTGTIDVDFDQANEVLLFVTAQTRFTTTTAPYYVEIASK